MTVAILVFLTSCYVLTKAYPALTQHLEVETDDFSDLEDTKKDYVIKNLVKAVYLCILSFTGLPLLCCAYFDYWPNSWIKCMAAMYCSNDIIGLYKVKKLPTSTRLHHSVTFVFLLATFVTDFQTNSVAQMLFIYTYCSAVTFPVNAYLGLRLCFPAEKVADVKQVAKYIYPIMCVINWSFQVALMRNTIGHIAYSLLLLFIVYDDLVLLRWLWK